MNCAISACRLICGKYGNSGNATIKEKRGAAATPFLLQDFLGGEHFPLLALLLEREEESGSVFQKRRNVVGITATFSAITVLS
jgi:hypothetical protein